ncbi:family 78 glycoside hydrolase catalytic domain [Nocardioides jensenii]|uniref:family 78 glycoside hydrolase catalytic domain n=1 Tax=Nocardioides jensenii TaxID=1843 RepID=UPI000835F91E|nr:family 78 glycoside hydrolase catalytic domain [Nocardioides jensenii]
MSSPSRRNAPRFLVLLLVLVAMLVTTLSVRSAPVAADNGALSVGELSTNHVEHPLGVPVEAPVLSWQLHGPDRGIVQSARQIQVSTSADGFDDAVVWDSGRVSSSTSVNVRYAGPALEETTRYHWRVRVWDGSGTMSPWSETDWFETALANDATSASDWGAHWIGGPSDAPRGVDWSDYTLTVRTSNVQEALGIVFYSDSAASQNNYMWQLSNRGAPSLRPHSRVNGTWAALADVPLGDDVLPGGLGAEHEITIDVSDGVAATSIDGHQIDSRPIPLRSSGTIGFRTAAGESGDVREVTVSKGEEVLFHTDFSDGVNPFAIGEVREGVLKVSGVVENGVMSAEQKALPLLRRDFVLDKQIASARLYSTALGVYRAEINGQRVGDHELAPGWTDYSQLVQYQVYDVTDHLQQGENTIGAELSNGWYAGHLAWVGANRYGSDPAFLARLEVTYEDGTTEVVGTDESWTTTPGPVLEADLLMGETYDYRRQVPGWSEPDATGDWSPARVLTPSPGELHAQTDPPARVTEERDVVELTHPQSDVSIYDLGQNMVGWVKVRLTGEAGDVVRIRHGEVLNPDGTLYTANLRTAKATETVTLGKDGTVEFSPRFTSHGFRYVEITGLDDPPAAEEVTGIVVGTDNPAAASFSTSDPMLNQLQSNISWGIRGNFLSVPTDTPARDERLGYSGDLNAIADTAVFNQDTYAFLTKWLRDMRLRQHPNGVMPGIAPGTEPGSRDSVATAGWGDGFITVTDALWRNHGDTSVIDENWSAMVRLVDHWTAVAQDGIVPEGHGIGDWLNLNDPTPNTLLATAFYALDARLLSEMAAATRRDEAAGDYRALYDDVRAAFTARFIAPDGQVGTGSQAGYAMAIDMGLVPEEQLDAVGRKFVAAIKARDWHLSTGFLGTPHLLPALSAVGRDDVAYRLLLEKQYPSWLYEVTKGATTTWERWDSIRPDGSFQDPGMNSFNHYAYGAVGEWMYSSIGGIQSTGPGYSTFRVAPRPGGELTHATISHYSPYGEIRSTWRTVSEDQLTLDVTVPANTVARVHVPAVSERGVFEGGSLAADAPGVRFVRMQDGAAVFEVGSGDYAFESDDVRGYLGLAAARSLDLQDSAAEVADSPEVPKVVHNRLPVEAGQLVRSLEDAFQAYLGGDTDLAAESLASGQARADRLRRLIDEWVTEGAITTSDADALTTSLARVDSAMSEAARRLHDISASLVHGKDPALPGSTLRVVGQLTNNGSEPVRDVTLSLDLPAGWSADPTTVTEQVGPGESIELPLDVHVAEDQPLGQGLEVEGVMSYRRGPATTTVPVRVLVDVVSPVRIVSMNAVPALLDQPGDSATVTITLRNQRPDAPLSGQLSFSAPPGWEVTPRTAPYELAASADAAVQVTVTSPADATNLAAVLAAEAFYEAGPAAGDSAEVRVSSALKRWEFNTAGDTEGWTPTSQLADFTVADGALRATSTGGDPNLAYGPGAGSFDVTQGAYLEITMASSIDGEGQLFWGTESAPGPSEGSSVRFGVQAGGEHVYLVPIPALDSPLTMLRLDPLSSQGDLEINSIRLIR